MPVMEEKTCIDCAYTNCTTQEYPCRKCELGACYPENKDLQLRWTPRGEGKHSSVNHPSHYNQGGIECIDAMIAAFGNEAVENFCLVNAFKYVWRTQDKNGLEDVDKAIWYLTKYKELVADGE